MGREGGICFCFKIKHLEFFIVYLLDIRTSAEQVDLTAFSVLFIVLKLICCFVRKLIIRDNTLH